MTKQSNLTNQILDFAAVSFEYLEAKRVTAHRRSEYTEARDKYLRGIRPIEFERNQFDEVVKLKGFQKATGKKYQAYLDAKAHEYNVKRRLDTRFRKMPADSIGIISSAIDAIGGAA